MGSAIVKLMTGIAWKLLTQELFARLIVEMLHSISKSTDTQADDRIFQEIAEKLGVKWPGKA